MQDEDNKITQYLIPANVSTKFEFFEGFGWYELKIVLITCLAGLLIYFSLGIFKKTIYVDTNNIPIEMKMGAKISDNVIKKKVSLISPIVRSFAIIIPGACAFFIVLRDPITGMCLVSTLKSQKAFKQKQKRYIYKYNSGTEGR